MNPADYLAWMRTMLNPFARNAGALHFAGGAPVTGPVIAVMPAVVCQQRFADFYAVNAADYATQADALRAFTASDASCATWAQAQIAALSPDLAMSDTQCANAWDAFPKTGYPTTVDALQAFGRTSPLCAAWVQAQVAATAVSAMSASQCAMTFSSYMAANPTKTSFDFRAAYPLCAAWSIAQDLIIGGVTFRTILPQASDSACAARFEQYCAANGAPGARTASVELALAQSFHDLAANADCKDWSEGKMALDRSILALPNPNAPATPTGGGNSTMLLLGLGVAAALAMSGKGKR